MRRALEDAPDWPQLVRSVNDNATLARDVLALLVSEAPRLGRLFEDSLRSQDIKGARRAVHTLKSNARHVHLRRVAAFAEQLENYARDEQYEMLIKQQDIVQQLTGAVADWADAMLREHSDELS